MTGTLALRPWATPQGPGVAWKPLASSIAADESVVSLWNRGDETRVSVQARTGHTREVRLQSLARGDRGVQVLSGERTLVTVRDPGPRGLHTTGYVYDGRGELLRSAKLGAYVTWVITSGGDEVWVGYDEQATELGSSPSPLVCFDSQLVAVWSYPQQGRSLAVEACSALNVDDDIWVTSDVARLVVSRARRGRPDVDVWSRPALADVGLGGRALVACGPYIATLPSPWCARPSRLTVARIEDQELRLHDSVDLTWPDGSPVPRDSQVLCRGNRLYLQRGNTWHRVSLNDDGLLVN